VVQGRPGALIFPAPADMDIRPGPGGSGAPATVLPSAPGGALDLHEGISPPRDYLDPLAGGCQRWPEHLRLYNATTGEVVYGRCRATNKCPYCQRLYVVETVEMLRLDALEWAPTLWTVLTAREHLTRPETYRHLEHLRRALRRRFSDAQWSVQVEFQKRGALHLNLLHKGVGDLEDVHELLSGVWCSRVDALPVGQATRELHDAAGVVGYLGKELAHGLKREQAPPLGWKGHRTSHTRGYLVRPTPVMREEARASLRTKRALWRAINAGYEGTDAEAAAERDLEQGAAADWRLRSINLRRATHAAS